MKFLKPIRGEEWIEKLRESEFWIGEKRSYPQKFYCRLCHSYIGWWLHLRLTLSRKWPLTRLSLLFDPLSSGGLGGHLRSFLFNAVVVDIWWRSRHWVWKLFHRRAWEQQRRFLRAAMQASEEGYADEMPCPIPGMEGRWHGRVLGKRYFKRVVEIYENTSGDDGTDVYRTMLKGRKRSKQES